MALNSLYVPEKAMLLCKYVVFLGDGNDEEADVWKVIKVCKVLLSIYSTLPTKKLFPPLFLQSG